MTKAGLLIILFMALAIVSRTTLRAIKRPSTQFMPFSLFSSNKTDTMTTSAAPKVQKSDSEWQAILSKEQFRVIREKGTERPGSHEYDRKTSADEGVYHCAACDAPLFVSKTKFKSGCGWPAFYDSIPGAVNRHEDKSMFMTRVEITCANCGGHLGHVFKGEGFGTPTDERHCVNGISLSFKGE
ncbi:SelR domain-domain-containing protein [Kockovaella imperatae]|uniref:Peptide-methionine (R)-S-oxide reductase n=1 Tax=Kockovaella imperatae TaxID=4999 RepID=A0A1Y1U735_9TREE|nr:SelR domain-domain-containing protein [Kockovaella imperatae]ORX33831.1 SelR domain-domain-containing protein [Kockovaella imperatae]